MIKRIFITSFILFSILSFSQGKRVNGTSGATWQKNEAKGEINGRVTNNTNIAIEYANVSIYDINKKKIIDGTITDKKGKFSFKDIVVGKYKLSISFLGYQTKDIIIETSNKNPNHQFKKILIEPSANQINEIEINETKAIYENKIDKIVYNPENDINQSADDATDVLRKAPLLSVDLDGNVSLRGSNNIKFLINGKASTFLTSDISSALKMIPADQIKSIEVITSPGAKYDGEGDAGIVNIITKKKIIDGYKATVSGSIGKRVSRNNLNLTVGKNNFGISAKGGIFGMYWPRIGKTDYIRKDWDIESMIDTNILIRNGETFSRWTGYRSGINMYYDVTPFTSFTSGFSFGGRDKFSDDSTQISYTGDTSYNYESIVSSNSISNQIEWTTDYTKRFANNPDRELTIAFQINGDFEDEKSNIYENNLITRNVSDGSGTERTFQLDYVHPFGTQKNNTTNKSNQERSSKGERGKGRYGKKDKSNETTSENKIEFGLKYIDRNNRFNYYTKQEDLENDSIYFLSNEETFNYGQTVASTYLSSQFSLPNNIGIVLGGRYELTNIDGKWKNNETDNFTREPYGNFLPNIVINKKISMTKSLKLSYNNRIRRPSSYYINPNIGRTDNKNIVIGNPGLKPALSNQLEFGYNSFSRFFQSSYYVYLKNTNDVIESNITIQGDTSITTYQNIGENSKLGFNYYGSITLKSINLRGGFNIFQYSSNDDRYGSIKAILYNYNFGGTIDLGNRYKFETWGWFSSPQQTLQGTTDSWSMMSFGIKKDFKNKRGSLGLSFVEPFNKYKNMTSEIQGESFTQYNNRQIAMRSIGISFSYTFGKLNFKEKRINSKIKNNDQIQGGGSEQ